MNKTAFNFNKMQRVFNVIDRNLPNETSQKDTGNKDSSEQYKSSNSKLIINSYNSFINVKNNNNKPIKNFRKKGRFIDNYTNTGSKHEKELDKYHGKMCGDCIRVRNRRDNRELCINKQKYTPYNTNIESVAPTTSKKRNTHKKNMQKLLMDRFFKTSIYRFKPASPMNFDDDIRHFTINNCRGYYYTDNDGEEDYYERIRKNKEIDSKNRKWSERKMDDLKTLNFLTNKIINLHTEINSKISSFSHKNTPLPLYLNSERNSDSGLKLLRNIASNINTEGFNTFGLEANKEDFEQQTINKNYDFIPHLPIFLQDKFDIKGTNIISPFCLKSRDNFLYKKIFYTKDPKKFIYKRHIKINNKLNIIYAEDEDQYLKLIEKINESRVKSNKTPLQMSSKNSMEEKVKKMKKTSIFMKRIVDYAYPNMVLMRVREQTKQLNKRRNMRKIAPVEERTIMIREKEREKGRMIGKAVEVEGGKVMLL